MIIYGQEIAITCEPSVFGDGNHETTRFLLYFLSRYAKGRTVIDAGCGTAILAIFSAKAGAKAVTAIDCDKGAIRCAQGNVAANKVENVTVMHADIAQADIPRADIATANFARWDAVALLPTVTNLLKPSGLLITTWYKEIPNKGLYENYDIIDCVEGIDYDCYVLKHKPK